MYPARNCKTCWHWKKLNCALNSCNCMTAVTSGQEPTRYLEFNKGLQESLELFQFSKKREVNSVSQVGS